MAMYKTTHPLLPLVFLVVALQWTSYMHCEGRVTNLNSNTPVSSQGERLHAHDATNPSGPSMLDDASTVTTVRQFIANVLNFRTTGDKNQHHLDFENEIEIEVEDKLVNTSSAGIVHNAENQEYVSDTVLFSPN